MDSYVVAGIADHLTPWQNCYRSVGLLCGDTRFVLAVRRPHRGLGQPAGQPGVGYQVNENNPTDPAQWLQTADRVSGTWWPDFVTWLGERCGADRAAPADLAGGGLRPLSDAPGTYVLDS